MNRPNGQQTWEELWAEHATSLARYGTALLWEMKDGQGRVIETHCVDPYRMVAYPASAGYPGGYYRYRHSGSPDVVIGAEHVKRTTRTP